MAIPRLPNPGGDDGQWGTILNNYLSQSHTPTGGIKADTVSTTQLVDGSITEAKLSTTLRNKVNALDGSIWIGSQAEYDALPSYSPDTLYVITGV